MLETWFFHMLSNFGSKIFQRWSYFHGIFCFRDNFWVTSHSVVENGNNIVLNYRFITSKTKIIANFNSNLIIVCYFKGRNLSMTIWYSKDIIWNEEIKKIRHACWLFLWQWWLQCFWLACSAQGKKLLSMAIPSNQQFCNSNFEIKQSNWTTDLLIHNVTIHNGNVEETGKHPQIKSEFAFTI